VSPVPELSVTEARSRLADFHVVDVREPHELDGPLGHIPGATLVPLGALDAAADSLANDRPILAVCRSGRRSERACEILAAHGRRATNLAGGMIAWNRAGLPVERREPASLRELRDAIEAWFAQLSGGGPGAARAAIESALREAGAGWDAPSGAGIERALARLAAAFDAAPPDLDVSLAYFRRALAAL
jgi:rhodanese-related sulfurtransferase